MQIEYKNFFNLLDKYLKGTIDKNIIIYGSNDGGDFIK